MKEDVIKALEEMGFVYNSDKNYWSKKIILDDKSYTIYGREEKNGLDFWTIPDLQKCEIEKIEEIMAIRKIEKMRKEKVEENHIQKLLDFVENDVIEFFGDTGTGKSKLILEIAKNGIKHGKRILFYDTEKNLTEEERKIISENGIYIYNPSIDGLYNFAREEIKTDKVNADVIIIDSLGFPVLTHFAELSQRQKGDALLQMIAILGILKEWCYRKPDRLAIITNQPESEMGVEKGERRKPFGDKSSFATKEIIELVASYPSASETIVDMKSFRSRKFGRDKLIGTMRITNDGVKITWKI